MRLRNAFRLLTYNFSNVYKLFLFRLICNLVFFCLAYVTVSFGLHAVFSSAEAKEIVDLLGEFFKALVSGRVAFLETFREEFTQALAAFLSMLGANLGSIIGSLVGVCALYIVCRFLNGTAVFALGGIVNDKMEFYGKTGFSSAYFKALGKGMLYQVIYVPLSFVYDVLLLLGCWFFFFYTPSLLSFSGIVTIILGLSVSLAVFLCFQALKLTFISAWIPAVVTGKKSVAGGMRESFCALRGFAGRFSGYLITLYLSFVVNLLFAVCTLGSLLLISIPASLLLVLILQFVNYYEDHDKKYFLSFRKISGADGKPEAMGD